MVSDNNKPRPKSVTYQEKPAETNLEKPTFQDENFQTTFQNFNENTHLDQCFKDYHLNQRPLSATGLAHTESRPQKDDISKKLHKIRPITANVMNPLISTKRKTNKDKTAENYFGPIPKVTETIRPASLHEVEDTCLNIHTDLIRKLNIENSDKEGIKNNFSKEHVKVEEMISLPQLREINRYFEKFDGKLDLEKFSEVILKVLNLESVRYEKHVTNLFMKIDTLSNSIIDWDQFCSYMQIELQEKERVQLERSRVRFNLPAIKPSLKFSNVQYRDICDVISVCELSDGGFITANVDGTLLFFPKMRRDGTVFPNYRRKVIIPHRNDLVSKNSSNSKNSGENEGGLKKWITDVSVAKKYNKVFVATGDRELLVYDLLSGDPYATLEGLDKLPVRMKVECVEEKIYIVIGDDTGCVSFFEISNASDVLRTWSKRVSGKKEKSDGKEIKGTINLDEFQNLPNVRHFRSQIHDDWITQIQIVAAARQFLTSSNSAGTSLVITPFTSLPEVGKKVETFKPRDRSYSVVAKDDVLSNNRKIGLRTFSVHKGVKTFSYCKSRLMILTGGLDRMIRQWNPFVPQKPTATLRGHNAPIEMLEIDAVNNIFVSIDMQKNIKVWNLINHTLLTDVYPKSHNISPTEISRACYLPLSETLLVCTDSVFGITMKPRVNLLGDSIKSSKKAHLSIRLQTGTNEAFTHKDPITACVFNPHFNQIITCSATSVVRIWNAATGELIFEFGGQASSNDGTTEKSSQDTNKSSRSNLNVEGHNGAQITSAILDDSGRRLITTGRDGKTCIWNPNSGACLKTLVTVGLRKKEVHDCVAITINQRNKFICTVGWERRVRLYSDHKKSDGDYKQIQNPSMSWSEDRENGHNDDIVAVAYCPPHLLATVDYSGMLFIWNIVSGHISKRIKYEPKRFSMESSEAIIESRQVIHAIVGLPKRHLENEASITEQFTSRPNTRQTGVSGTSSKGTQMSAVLAIGTCDGYVSFYTNSGKCYASNCMTEREPNIQPPAVTTLNVSKDETLLIIGDADGYITIADITNFAKTSEFECNKSGECKKALILKRWRAHITSVTGICALLRKPVEVGSVENFEDSNQLVSISSDKRARVWSFAGHFIGTLGQEKPWDNVMADTWQHPSQPEDVLFHHASIPKSLSRINEDINSEPLDYQAVSDQLFEQSTLNKSSEFKQKSHDTAMTNTYTRKQATLAEVEDMIKNFKVPKDNGDSGKQLRAITMKSNREKTLNNPVKGEAAHVKMCDTAVFRKLLTFDLVDAPAPKGKDVGKETRLYDDSFVENKSEVVASKELDVSVSKMREELDEVRLKSAGDKARTVKFHIA